MAEIQEQSIKKPDLSVLAGNEKKVNYKILPVPSDRSRFSFTANIVGDRLGNLVYVNLLMLVLFTPLIALFVYRYSSIITSGMMGAFGDNLGVGYPASPDTVGLAEQIILKIDLIFFAIAIAMSCITAVGVAGGVYCVRKLLRSDDEFHLFKDFFHGVKQNYLTSLIACAIVFVALFLFMLAWNQTAYEIAVGGNFVLQTVWRVLACLAAAIVVIFALWLLSVGTNYRQNAWGLVKNSLSLGAGTVLQSVVFLALALSPLVLLLLDGFFSLLVSGYFMLMGISIAILIWCSFSDWAFDTFADYTAIQTNEQEAAEKKALAQEESEVDIMTLLLTEEKKSYLAQAVLPLDKGTAVYTMPEKFNENDLALLAQSKQKIQQECAEYTAKNSQTKEYKEYNARFEAREKALTETDKKGKKKQFAPTMLNQQ
ncbi:MAG: hypothetical protein IKC91_00280 [Clostridia bacterium]|nr:hypothetical protein [Clostridia bacterium]